MASLSVAIHRSAMDAPWGFRLQGGHDYAQPLRIQRVFPGSPSDGHLHRGDMITSINGQEVNHISHTEALNLITDSGVSLTLGIRRSDPFFVPPAPAPQTRPQLVVQMQPEGPQYNHQPHAQHQGLPAPGPRPRGRSIPPSTTLGLNYNQARPGGGRPSGPRQGQQPYLPDYSKHFAPHRSTALTLPRISGGAGGRRMAPVPERTSKWAPSATKAKELGWTPGIKTSLYLNKGRPVGIPVNRQQPPHHYKQRAPSAPAVENRNMSRTLYINTNDPREAVPPPWQGSLRSMGVVRTGPKTPPAQKNPSWAQSRDIGRQRRAGRRSDPGITRAGGEGGVNSAPILQVYQNESNAENGGGGRSRTDASHGHREHPTNIYNAVKAQNRGIPAYAGGTNRGGQKITCWDQSDVYKMIHELEGDPQMEAGGEAPHILSPSAERPPPPPTGPTFSFHQNQPNNHRRIRSTSAVPFSYGAGGDSDYNPHQSRSFRALQDLTDTRYEGGQPTGAMENNVFQAAPMASQTETEF